MTARARVIRVIETNIERRGSGKDSTSPIRVITQYWSEDGELLAEVDPCSLVVPIEDDPRQQQTSTPFGGAKP